MFQVDSIDEMAGQIPVGNLTEKFVNTRTIFDTEIRLWGPHGILGKSIIIKFNDSFSDCASIEFGVMSATGQMFEGEAVFNGQVNGRFLLVSFAIMNY